MMIFKQVMKSIITVETRLMASLRWWIPMIITIPLLLLSPFPAAGQSPDHDTDALAQYIRIALEQNPGLQAAASEAESARLDAPQFSRLMDPMLAVEYDVWNRENMDRLEVMLMQPVPWFGTLGANRRYFDRLADAQETAVEQSRNELIRDVRLSWYRMHEVYHHIHILEAGLELLGSIERQLLARIEGGRASQVELIRVEVEQDEIRNQISVFNNDLRAETARFNALLNRDQDAEVTLFPYITPAQVPETDTITLNPEIRELELRKEAAELNTERARLNARPDFNVGVGFMSRDFGLWDTERFNAVMVRLEVGLPFSRTRYRAEQNQVQVQARLADELRAERINRLHGDYQRLRQELDSASETITLYTDRLIPSLNRAIRLSLESYGTGGGSFEEIIRLQRQILELEMKLNEAQTDRNQAAAELDYLTGMSAASEN